jgi:tRNA threonylcarbamoyladenosine biosynthesis protein TsaB
LAYILCIETSTTNCSVAVSKDDELLSLVEEDSNTYSHAEQLHVFISKAIQQSGIENNQLNAIAISKGPGSYTGLRIGVSTAKGLCYALNIPLLSISTLKSLAAQVNDADFIIPMIDARRMEVYTQTFHSDLTAVTEIEAKILDESSFSKILNLLQKVCFIGNGVAKFKAICAENNKINFVSSNPSAKQMISLASQKIKQGIYEDVAYFEPFYLKDFVGG